MRKKLKNVFLLVLCLLTLISITACGKPKEEQVRKKMEQHLYEKYGEEFVVDRIGTRSANNQKFYQARIYPKSIIGTEKEDDTYYYSTASAEIGSLGKIAGNIADSYSEIKMNEEAENYLLPKAKKLFGERIRLKASVDYKRKYYDSWYSFIVADFKERIKETKETPEERRLELTLYLYLFDRIDNEEEKEERREQIFEFIQYLKVEGLFEYIQLYIKIVDERVLTNSYREFRNKEKYSRTEELKIDNIIVDVPPLEFRKKMTKVLSEELEEMTEEELIRNMNKIKKNEIGCLAREGIVGNSLQVFMLMESKGRLKLSDRHENLSNLEKIRINYENKKDIKLEEGFLYKYKAIYLK